jgi:hypothetical protein
LAAEILCNGIPILMSCDTLAAETPRATARSFCVKLRHGANSSIRQKISLGGTASAVHSTKSEDNDAFVAGGVPVAVDEGPFSLELDSIMASCAFKKIYDENADKCNCNEQNTMIHTTYFRAPHLYIR